VAAERLIGRLATIVTIACVAVVALTVAAIASPTFRARFGFARPASYPAGSAIDVPGHLYSGSPQTLFVFIRSSCIACQNAKPMFSTIKADLEKVGVSTTLITNGQNANEEAAYAKELGVDASKLIAMNVSAIKLAVVPTLALVNERGEVLYSVEGIPTDPQRQELLTAVASQPKTR
jgi:hypothetical protein